MSKNFTKYVVKERLNTIVNRRKKSKNSDLFHKCFLTAKDIICHIFGESWVNTNFNLDKVDFELNKGDYRMDLKNVLDKKMKIINLAELVYSMQNYKQVSAILNRIYHGEIEAGFFELEVAGVFTSQKMDFEFNAPNDKKKESYDFSVQNSNGQKFHIEVKCKLSNSKASTSSIRNTLKKARMQLPNDGNGVIFIKYPRDWLENESFLKIDSEVYEKFMRNTTRVKQVIVFLPWVNYLEDRVQSCTLYQIIENRKFSEFNIFSAEMIEDREKFSLFDILYGDISSHYRYFPLN